MSIATIGTVVGAGTAIAGAASGGKGDDEGPAKTQESGYGLYDPIGADRKTYLMNLRNFMADPSSLYKSKAYKARFQAGQEAITSSAASRGLLDSGAMGIELQQRGQEIASEEYDKEFQRLSMLAGAGFSPTIFGSSPPTGSSTGEDVAGAVGGIFNAGQSLYDTWGGGGDNPSLRTQGGMPTYDWS